MNKKLYLTILTLFFSCSKETKYNVVGVIHKIHLSKNELTINHDEIPGFMSAMTMNFKIDPDIDLNQFNIGDSVHFELYIKEHNAFSKNFKLIDNVKIDSTAFEDDFWFEDEFPYVPLDIGDTLSNTIFTNYDNYPFYISSDSKKFKFITFIFSKCPMPNMCPALIFKQQYLASQFSKNNTIEFITISFDYIHDTPNILKNKYKTIIDKYDNWHMLSSVGHINDLMIISKQSMFSFWGVEDNDIGHNMRTLLVGPDMKILKNFDGMDWLPKDAKESIDEFLKVYN